ncbi:OmpA family protein [Roseicyclus marinus]|uniref:OmpA family protein n=1 Tax=Roseicyclus marinus TaxID=2161673 RepID=UPI00240F293F|nr:OmpA family protein [Roseicyclus marinus]MDG3041540.1 OmpA family protein [Roseicyclus marinus]
MTHSGRAPRPLPHLILPLGLLCAGLPAVALAQDLAWPVGAERVAQAQSTVSGYAIATGPHDGQSVPVTNVSGSLLDEIWTLPDTAADPARLAEQLSADLTAQGYEILYACADTRCGGFDFRFALPIAQGPDMHVDLGRFQYLAAVRQDAEGREEHLAFTLSQGGQLGYAHLARVLDGVTPIATEVVPAPSTPRPAAGDSGVIATLLDQGAVTLDDVSFPTGASALSDSGFESLAALAGFLGEDAARRIVLVGHTDTDGSLEGNIALSRDRAGAVRTYLIDRLGVNPAQVEAQGIGYLAPRASNATTTGREANRRVEAVLIAG